VRRGVAFADRSGFRAAADDRSAVGRWRAVHEPATVELEYNSFAKYWISATLSWRIYAPGWAQLREDD
jgi:hypothetical protein